MLDHGFEGWVRESFIHKSSEAGDLKAVILSPNSWYNVWETISQPYIVARMTECLISDERLSDKPLNNTLEIGTGCGYQTYLLSLFSEKVTTIERIAPLQEKAKKTLKGLKT